VRTRGLSSNGTAAGFECRDVSLNYESRGATIRALESVTFQVGGAEFLCIVGPSGCGKTTLLKIVAGLLRPSSGSLVFSSTHEQNGGSGQRNRAGTSSAGNGKRAAETVRKASGKGEDAGGNARPRTALVFQEHGVFPWLTVLENVAFGLEMHGVRRHEREERALGFIEQMGLGSFARNYPHELSVGMRQRVGIARAFVTDVPILLMDEPFGSLDAQTKRVLQEELLRIWRDRQKLVVYVTHDIEEAVLLGDRVLVMTGRPGRIREDIPIPLDRPRELSARERPLVSEIKWHIWRLLEDEVRRELAIPS
jgi:NitT/TauT family transport system ATP-binding protein